MNTKLYRTYTTEDFVMDENFSRIMTGKPGSKRFLEKLIEKLPEKSQEIELAVSILKELHSTNAYSSSDQKLELWNRIIWQRKRHVRLQFLRYAAAFLLLLGIGSAMFYLSNKPSSLQDFAALNKVSYKNAALILADGKKIDISSKDSKVQYSKDGEGVSVNDTTRMDQSNLDNGINQLIVPFGKRSMILLSDGTRVWLNSGSRLVYTPVFKGKTREVFLEGEGYFEVAKNPDKPFYVKTDEFRVKVYGTKFDVQAYKIDDEYNAILLEGKVSLDKNEKLFSKEVIMAPGEKASLFKEFGDFQLTKVEKAENYIGWIDGYLTFDNEKITDLIKRVSHYYNISIDSNIGGSPVKISGKLDLKDDPERVLTALAVISNTRYVKKDNKYLFYE
jgi:transmembrane sensor